MPTKVSVAMEHTLEAADLEAFQKMLEGEAETRPITGRVIVFLILFWPTLPFGHGRERYGFKQIARITPLGATLRRQRSHYLPELSTSSNEIDCRVCCHSGFSIRRVHAARRRAPSGKSILES